MHLDWSLVKQKYGGGAEVPTVAGNKVLQITGVDDEKSTSDLRFGLPP